MIRGVLGVALVVTSAVGCASIEAPHARTADRVEARLDIPYQKSAHPKHRLDVFAPAVTPLAGGLPVVMFVHGGYWVSGDRRAPDHGHGLYGRLGEALARRGIVAMIPSYRLSPEVTIDGMLEDVARAARWAHDNAVDYGATSRRLILMGHSAGGHLVAMLATDDAWLARVRLQPDDVRGYIAMSAIWDVTAMHDAQPERFNRAVTYPVFGRDPEQLARYSPIERISERRRPFLLVVAERDFPYLLPQGQRALIRLLDVGGEATLKIAVGYDHLDVVRKLGDEGDEVAELVAAFARAL